MKQAYRKTALMAATFLSLLPWAACAEDTAITIYSSAEPGAVNADSYRPVNGQTGYMGVNVPGYGVVRQVRHVSLPEKKSVTRFSDVASLIDPTTVQFKSLTDPEGTKVGEQDYQFDLVSQQKLLEKYIDRKISVDRQIGDKSQTVEGTLLSTQGGLMLKTVNGIEAVNGYSTIRFPELPGGLITKPTLVWTVYTGHPGEHKTEVSYETKGITWWADYNLIFHEGEDGGHGTVDFGSWVSIVNQTGATYDGAKLKLVAGDVARAEPPASLAYGGAMKKDMAEEAAVPAPPSFQEKSFFEYHLYTLNQPVTLPDNSTKQMELIPAATQVPVEKQYVYNGLENVFWNGGIYTDRNYGAAGGSKKVEVFLKLKNTKENGLGAPLPAGRIRVNERDSDGSLEFIGENVIDHTPRNEDVLIKLGNAFDVVAERRQVNYTLDTGRHSATEEIEVKLRNQKKQSVTVKVLENMYRAVNWEIADASADYKKENAHRVSFNIPVEPGKEALLHYTVHYSW